MKKGFVCLAVLVFLGDILLKLRFSGNLANDISGIIGAFILSFLTLLLVKGVIYVLSRSSFRLKNAVCFAFSVLALLFLLVISLFTLYNFSRFAAPVMLSTNNIFFPFLIMLAISLLLGVSGKKVFFKLSLITLPIAAVIIIIMAAFSVQFMSLKYLIPYKSVDASFIEILFPLYLNLTASLLPLFLLQNKTITKTFCASYSLTFFIIGICVLNVLGIFGSEFASTLNYPYSLAVSTASMGEIFSRLDGFFYAICFFTVLLKTGLCIYTFKETLKKLINTIKQ
ncbi:MAG: GerAB/ArcD/ProY family transporter [Clostridia bacterium]|nr:GerAB/ArcD/ProY family transporter [Clostridia bacterium]